MSTRARSPSSAPTWIAVPIGRQNDPRVRRLAKGVGEPLAEAWIMRVEGWLKLYATDGQVRIHSVDISDAIRWPYRIGVADAFDGAGLLNPDGTLSGWAELNGWLAERAQRERDRLRTYRKGLKKRTRTVRVPTDRPTDRPTDPKTSRISHSDTAPAFKGRPK